MGFFKDLIDKVKKKIAEDIYYIKLGEMTGDKPPSNIENIDVITKEGPNKRYTIYKNAEGEIEYVQERDTLF